jgi:hypothetical protein
MSGQCCCCCLEPVVMFNVSRRVRGAVGAWLKLGNTIDLSEALRCLDALGGAHITVGRGFMDKGGRLYGADRMPIPSLCVG